MTSEYEKDFVKKMLIVLRLRPAEEKAVLAYIEKSGIDDFLKHYDELQLDQDTMIKLKALVALLEADYDDWT